MAMRGKIPKEVQAIFEKYMHDGVARRLKREEALTMLQTEFGLSTEQAEKMFDTFDKDKNGIMSIWEFQQFYQCVGNTAVTVVEKFEEMDKDNSGKIDLDEAREGLRAIELVGGRKLEEREIDFFLKSSLGADNLIDLGEFAGLLYKLKMFEKKKLKK